MKTKNTVKASNNYLHNCKFNHLTFERLRQGPTSILNILAGILEFPDCTPTELRQNIDLPKNYAKDSFFRIRKAGLAISDKGHYNLTTLGEQLLYDYGEVLV